MFAVFERRDGCRRTAPPFPHSDLPGCLRITWERGGRRYVGGRADTGSCSTGVRRPCTNARTRHRREFRILWLLKMPSRWKRTCRIESWRVHSPPTMARASGRSAVCASRSPNLGWSRGLRPQTVNANETLGEFKQRGDTDDVVRRLAVWRSPCLRMGARLDAGPESYVPAKDEFGIRDSMRSNSSGFVSGGAR
jgi:hypothetical protein